MLSFWKEKSFYYPFIIWFIIVLWYCAFAHKFFSLTSLKFQDRIASGAFYMFSHVPKDIDKIAIVAIDEVSRRHLNLKWPWPRSTTAQLIQNIAENSPKTIGLDIIFSGASEEEEDKKLASILKSYPGIILGYRLGRKSNELPLAQFIPRKEAIGFVNKPADDTKVTRETRTFYIDKDNNRNISIDVRLAAEYFDIPQRKIKLNLREGIFLDKQHFIPSPYGITHLNYLAHYKEFETIPAFLILEKKISPDIFKNKIVLVGATDPLIHDEYSTPLGVFPGVSIIANSLLMILEGKFIHNLSFWQILPIIFILGIIIIYINSRLAFLSSSVLTFFILALVYFGSLYLRAKGIQFDYFSILSLCFLSYVVYGVYKYTYLMYMRGKLKNLAVVDSLTGFYTLRYFLLKLDEEIKNKWDNLAFVALVMSNYKKINLELSFEELKSLRKITAGYAKSSLQEKFKKIIFSQISQDIIGITLGDKIKRQDLEGFFKNFLEKLNKVEFKLKDRRVKAKFLSILVHLPKTGEFQGDQIIYTLESFLKKYRKGGSENFISVDLAKVVGERTKESSREDILDFLASDLEERNKDLEKMLKELLESHKETEKAYFEVICSLNKALEEKDTFTQGHSERVARYAKGIAQEAGLSEEEAELIYKAALLHDIGKIGISDYILHKKDKLSKEEINLIRKHAVLSVEILKPIKVFKDLFPIILHHHEYFDGTGYPYGLSGKMIPRGAQILAVADAFDAITSGRGYKKGQKNIQEAIEELKKHKNIQFNPVYVEALIRVVST